MKRSLTRRMVIAGGSMIFASLASARPAMGRAPPYFAPPDKPMTLTRKLFRYLIDGKQIVVTRSWMVTFTPNARGYQIQGRQSDCSVDAPPSLTFFAHQEETRIEEAIFPLVLDQDGLIIKIGTTDVSDFNQPLQLLNSIEKAQQVIERSHVDPKEEQTADIFIQSLSEGRGMILSQMPRDLFVPRNLTIDKTVALPLPDGKSGTVRIQQNARLEPNGGIMREFQREIITDSGERVSRSREEWALHPLHHPEHP